MPKKNKKSSASKPRGVTLAGDLAAGKRLVHRALAVLKGAATLGFNTEQKHIDAAYAAAVSTTPVITCLNAVAQGDTNITREGSSLKAVGFEFRYYLSMNASASTSAMRVIIFMDTRNAGAAPTVTDVLASSVVGLLGVDNQPGRFVILYDHTSAHTLASETRAYISQTLRIPAVDGCHFSYNGNAGTVADCRAGALFLYVISNEATNTMSIDFQSRLWFVDN
jgi:hypothetical protein